MLGNICATAQPKDKRTYKKETTASPTIDLQNRSAGLQIGKKKKAIPEPLAPTPLEVGDFHTIGSTMPKLRVVSATGAVYTDADLKNDANLFVMMFNPTCEHCEDMTRAIEKDVALFRNSNIVLLAAPGMGPYLEYFDKTTKYTQFPALKVGLDSAKFIDRTFNYETLPQVNVYDKNRVLIKSFSGITTLDSLKPYIQ